MYGLIGKCLTHSFSADFFNSIFKEVGLNEVYLLFNIDNLLDIRSFIINNGIKGLNVTFPYKETIIPHLDYLSPEAKEIGAVNVIKVIYENNKIILKGYNTDYKGFKDSLLNFDLKREDKALILGTGGAAKAVSYAFKNLNICCDTVSRNRDKGTLTYDDLTQELQVSYKILVNTTPLGTFPNVNECPEINYNNLNSTQICYDLVYNPYITLFLRKSAEKGAILKNGLEMLKRQAIESWKIWDLPLINFTKYY